MVTSFAAGTAAAVARGGKVAIQQVAVDAFGNALGSSLAIASTGVQTQGQGLWSRVDHRNGSDVHSDIANERRTAGAFSESSGYWDDAGEGGWAGSNALGSYSASTGQSDRDRHIARMLNLANRPDAGSFESLRQPDGTFQVEINGIGSRDRWIPNGNSDLDGGTVLGGRMTQAEMDEFDRLNAAEVESARVARYGSISAIQPSVFDQVWFSPQVQHVMSHTGTGKLVGAVVNAIGSVAASVRSDRYNFATGRTLNPVEQRNARIDHLINFAALPFGGGIAGATRAEIQAGARIVANSAGANFERIVSQVPGRTVGRADALNPGSLGNTVDSVAATFSGGRYATVELSEDLILHRAWAPGQSREFGGFWSLEKPAGSLQSRIDAALLPEWGTVRGTSFRSQATDYTTIKVPAGTRVHAGEVGGQGGPWVGGGSQLLIEGGPQEAWKIGGGKLW
jgi:hypothetical protein